MNSQKLKMKYHLGVWKELPDYPTAEDLIYELNIFLSRDGRPNGDFSEQTFNAFLPKGWEEMKYSSLIQNMIQEGTFLELQKESSKKWYKIQNNPHF